MKQNSLYLVRVKVRHASCAQLSGDVHIRVQDHIPSLLVHIHVAVHPGYEWVANEIWVLVVQAPDKSRHTCSLYHGQAERNCKEE